MEAGFRTAFRACLITLALYPLSLRGGCAKAVVAEADAWTTPTPPEPERFSNIVQIRFYNEVTGHTILVRPMEARPLEPSLRLWRNQVSGARNVTGTADQSIAVYPLTICTVFACYAGIWRGYYDLTRGLLAEMPILELLPAAVLPLSVLLIQFPFHLAHSLQERQFDRNVDRLVENAVDRAVVDPKRAVLILLSNTHEADYQRVAGILRRRGYTRVTIP